MTGLQLENYTISAQQRKYMKNERRNLYIALEELDMLWDEDEVAQVKEAWNNNESVFAIGEKMQRDPDEVALLIMDLARKGAIGKRALGLGA
ncbi:MULTISPECIES: helix-turn-helix domain-containing protein [Bacillus cereus group]|uniref:helix-turn-helix domain-containing protein n=1 Tax=Bacillus cereus group TaxID=86661 RepID=UPI0029612197|nr:helix-turn-helix domain-containing protein [Bacillus cereus]HEF1869702.1 helix-turn-helix domain-containing protein [Bacillus cereus]HEF1880266.1 helix-turn-helix domain-containing protein [Bacillus cereus]HEF1886333.1 helix-turn-helix domain-containing protein [Bacillus cereus]